MTIPNSDHKIVEYDTTVSYKIVEYDTTVSYKIVEYDTTVSYKIEEYDTTVSYKIVEYDTTVSYYQLRSLREQHFSFITLYKQVFRSKHTEKTRAF